MDYIMYRDKRYSTGWSDSFYGIVDASQKVVNKAIKGLPIITKFKIPSDITTIGMYAFENNSFLLEVTISDGVTVIGYGAFQNCTSLTSVTIGNGVTSINDVAFNGCTSLTDVYYSGTQEEWNAITIGPNNEPLTNATIHFNA